MRRTTFRMVAGWAIAALCFSGLAVAAEKDKGKEEKPGGCPKGFTSLFNGKDLSGWDGNSSLWSVRDGAIVGRTTKDRPIRRNTFLIWRGGKPGDFELRIRYRISGHNSGVQYRSRDRGKFVVSGYQADIDYANRYTGILYEEGGRGIVALRGTKVVIHPDGKKELVGRTATEKEVARAVRKDAWNDYVILAKGNRLVQRINGVTTVDVTDNQKDKRSMSGVIAVQLHRGPPMKVEFKDIYLKDLSPKKKPGKDDGGKK